MSRFARRPQPNPDARAPRSPRDDDGEQRTRLLLDDGGDIDLDEMARGTTWREDEVHLDPARFARSVDPWPSDPRERWTPQDNFPNGGSSDAFGWDFRVGGAAPLGDEPDPEAAWDLDENSTFFGEEFGGGDHNMRRSVEPQVRARNRGPKGWVRGDQRIHEDVCEAVAGIDVDLEDVEVVVDHGVVSFVGTVPDRLSRFRLEQCALGVKGVQDVDNQLRLKHRPTTSAWR